MKHRSTIFVSLMRLFMVTVILLSSLSLSLIRLKAQTPTPTVNIPYTSATSNLPVNEGAVFWLGKVGPDTDNFADVRVIHNDEKLTVVVHVYDRKLRYDTTPTAAEMTDFDSVTLYLRPAGNAGSMPDSGSHQFVGQFNFHEPRQDYQVAYQGDGAAWAAAATAFETVDGWQGNGPNDDNQDNGWNIIFRIPYANLGLAGKPADGTVWGAALAVHDRDDAAGSFIADKVWPTGMDPNQPSTWARFHFGLPSYTAPSGASGGVETIRHGLNGIAVEDGHVGGDSVCAAPIHPNYWQHWGNLNYSSGPPRDRSVVQNQWNLGDWPCFSKYYVTFPLDSIPADKTILSASLTMIQFGNSNQGGGFDPSDPPDPSVIQILTVGDDWDEATLTWNNAPQAIENVSRTVANPLPGGPPWLSEPRIWDVSRAVADAYQSGQPLRLALYSADKELHSGKYFRSSDFSDPASRPTPAGRLGHGRSERDAGVSGDSAGRGCKLHD